MESNNLLYHYTDIKAAIGILKSGVLYFSHYSKMNDVTEFKHADRFILETIEKATDDLLCGKNKISNLPDSIDYEKLKKEVAKDFQDILSEELEEEFYIFSSTQHDDDYEKDHGSLVMWRGYGKKNGCSIVFDKNQLESIFKTRQKQKKYGVFICDKVKYLHEYNTEIINKAFGETYVNFYKNLRINLKAIFEAHIDGKYEAKKEDYIRPFIAIKSLLKHPAFNSEKEYRMGIFTNIDSNDDGSLIKVEGGLIKAEDGIIKLPIAEQGFPIKKIIVSPIGDYQDINVDFLRWFIQSDPRYHGIEVTKSAIPHI